MPEIHTFKNKRGANIEIGEIRPNSFEYYSGCTVDVQITVYTDDLKRKFSFWLLGHDTGWDGDSIMDGIYESEFENNEDFDEDMELGDIYTEEELEEMAWDDIMDGYEFDPDGCPFLDYINRIEDALAAKAGEQFEDSGIIKDADIDALFAYPLDEFWEDLKQRDLIDFVAMAEEDAVFVRKDYGERYTDLVEDFEIEFGGEDTESDDTPESQEALSDAAVQYCKVHPVDCLLLPYAICEGMLDTHFVQPRGLLEQVKRLLNRADWSDDEAAEEALLAVRKVVLTELKKARWLDLENWNYRRYKYYDDEVDEAAEEIEHLCKIFEELCPKSAHDIKLECPFELSSDRTADIFRLRDECNVVIPEKIAYDFLVDTPMREDYSKTVLHWEKYFEPEKLVTRLELVKDELFEAIEDNYLDDEHIEGLFDAAIVMKEYDSESFVARMREAESEDDYFEENDSGGVYSHGIHYFCTDYEFSYRNSKWVVENPGLIRVTSNKKTEYRGSIHIPSTLEYRGQRYPVDSVASYAFCDCAKVTKVVFDEGVTVIEKEAFSGCTGLGELSLPSSLKELEMSCFKGCTGLKRIFIPAGVTVIDLSCFENCSQLTDILVDDANPVFKSADGILCDKKSDQKVYIPEANKAKDEDLSLQGEVIEEEDGSFSLGGIRYETLNEGYWTETSEWKYRKIIRVLPSSEDAPYSGKLVIPAKVKYHGFWLDVTDICEDAFSHCPDLLQVDVPAGIKWMKLDLTGSTNLSAINIDGASEQYVSIDGIVYNKKLTEIVCYPPGHGDSLEIPATVKSIGKVFKDCTLLRRVTIPSSVTELSFGAFEGCSGLEEIYVPGSIKCIKDDCFNDCKGLITVTLGEGVETVESAFAHCTSLQRIVFPDSLKTVKASSFIGCSAIESIRFPNNRYPFIKALPEQFYPWGQEPFVLDGIYYEPCRDGNDEAALRVAMFPKEQLGQAVRPGVNSLCIPALVEQYGFTYKVKQIWSDCAQCPDLQRMELPKTITDIRLSCPSLKEIVVDPANPVYASIDGILYGDGLRKLVAVPKGREISKFTVGDGVETIAEKLFSGRTDLKEVVLPDSVKEIESNAFENCTSLSRFNFNKGLQKIGSGAFQNTALTSVKLPSSLKDICQEKFTGVKPFARCRNLKAFVVTDEKGLFTAIDGLLYLKSSWGLKLIFCPSGFTGKLVLPDGVYSIQDDALCGIEGLESVVMPDSLKRIESWAFAMCKSLKEVVLSRELQYVGSCAFRECPSLKELDFKRCKHYFGYEGIDTSAFMNNPQLKLILPADMEDKRKYFEREMKEK